MVQEGRKVKLFLPNTPSHSTDRKTSRTNLTALKTEEDFFFFLSSFHPEFLLLFCPSFFFLFLLPSFLYFFIPTSCLPLFIYYYFNFCLNSFFFISSNLFFYSFFLPSFLSFSISFSFLPFFFPRLFPQVRQYNLEL